VLAIVFTYSRGALLGLGVIACLLFLQSRRKLLLAVIAAPISLIAVGFLPAKLVDRTATIQTYEEDGSAMERLRAWSVSKNVALQHPVGAGFGLEATPLPIWEIYADIKGPQFQRPDAAAAHSIYFQVLGDHGFPGLALFLGVLIGTFITLSRVKARIRGGASDSRRWMYDYATGLQIGLVGYMASGAFVSLAYFDLFYTYVVLAAIMWREVKQTSDQSIRAGETADFVPAQGRGAAA
jgi:probable O-glycosylation ligase (exosortase A-associated)